MSGVLDASSERWRPARISIAVIAARGTPKFLLSHYNEGQAILIQVTHSEALLGLHGGEAVCVEHHESSGLFTKCSFAVRLCHPLGIRCSIVPRGQRDRYNFPDLPKVGHTHRGWTAATARSQFSAATCQQLRLKDDRGRNSLAQVKSPGRSRKTSKRLQDFLNSCETIPFQLQPLVAAGPVVSVSCVVENELGRARDLSKH